MGKLLKSSFLILMLSLFQRIIGLLSIVILARILMPSDFGIIAICTFFIFLSETLTTTGIQQYLVQKSKLNDVDINTAWTLDVLMKTMAMAIIIIIAPILGYLWKNHDISLALAILSIGLPLRAFINPGLHIDRRELRYEKIFRIDAIRKLSSFSLLIPLALLTKSFWAIVITDIFSISIAIALSYYYKNYRPKISFKNIVQQWDFSKWMLSRGVLGYLRTELDIFVVKSYFPIAALGGYKNSKEITTMPANDVIRPIIEPLLAKLTENRLKNIDSEKIVQRYIQTILIFTIPVAVYLNFYHELVTELVFGEKFIEYSVVIKWLSLLLVSFSVNPIIYHILISSGKVKTSFYYDLFTLIITTTGILLSFNLDLENFSLIRGGLSTILIFSGLAIVVYWKRYSLRSVLLSVLLPTGISIISALLFPKLSLQQNNLLTIGHSILFFISSTTVTALFFYMSKNKVFLESLSAAIKTIGNFKLK